MAAKKVEKDTRKVHGSEGKKDLNLFDPDKLVLVTDPKSDLYDRRVHEEPTEELILSIMYYGVVEPILVRKNSETGDTEVMDGRKRTKAARVANKRLVARGDKPLRVPAVAMRPTSVRAIGIMITTNEQRYSDTPLNKAEKASRMIDRGATEEEVGVALGMKAAQVKNLLALIDAPAFVRQAVEAQKITLSNGIKAARLSEKEGPDEGRKIIEKLILEAPRTPGKKRNVNSRKAREIVDGPSMRSKREIRTMAERLSTPQIGIEEFGDLSRRKAITETLRWVLGEADLAITSAPAPKSAASA